MRTDKDLYADIRRNALKGIRKSERSITTVSTVASSGLSDANMNPKSKSACNKTEGQSDLKIISTVIGEVRVK